MIHEMIVRVRYVDTDQMGVVYYARYLEWFEMGRTELLRKLGFPYQHLEGEGLYLPVIEAHCNYINPAYYDDLVTIKSAIGVPLSIKIKIAYEIARNEKLLASGYTVHAFTGRDGRPKRPPRSLLKALSQHAEEHFAS